MKLFLDLPLQEVRKAERQRPDHVEYRVYELMARRCQSSHDVAQLLIVHPEHGLGDVFHTQVKEVRIDIAYFSMAPRRYHPFSILAHQVEKPGHAARAKRGLYDMAVVRPHVVVRSEQSIAKQHLQTSQRVGLNEILRMVNQHVGDCHRIGDDIERLPHETCLHDASNLLTALKEIQSI